MPSMQTMRVSYLSNWNKQYHMVNYSKPITSLYYCFLIILPLELTNYSLLFLHIFRHSHIYVEKTRNIPKHFRTNLRIYSIFGIKTRPRSKSAGTSRSGDWDARTTFKPSKYTSKFIIFEFKLSKICFFFYSSLFD